MQDRYTTNGDLNSARKQSPNPQQYDHTNRPSASAPPRDAEDDDLLNHIEMLEEHQLLCEKEGRYVEAEMAKNKLVELKKQVEVLRRRDTKAYQIDEKALLEQEHIEEFKEFNEFWDQKMAEFDEQARLIEEQTIQRHQMEMEKFIEELDQSLPQRPKDSPALLDLRRIQLNLAKNKDYMEAHKVQQQVLKLERDEFEKFKFTRDKRLLNQKAQLDQKQANELNALRKRIATGQDEQRKARSVELERLLQKYQNARKELDTKHQFELLRITSPKGGNAMTGSLFRTQGSRAGTRSTYTSRMSPGLNRNGPESAGRKNR